MRKGMEDVRVILFDMSRDPMTADSELFTDAAHSTESGTSIALTHLLDDARFQVLFPDVSTNDCGPTVPQH